MDIFELDTSLPGGFHDALVSSLSIDYVARTLEVALALCVGDPDASSVKAREERRRARLRIAGLIYCVIDPPDALYPYAEADELMIDIDRIDASSSPPLPEDLPPGAFSFRVWVNNWNAFIYVAATSAKIEWLDES